MGVEEILVFKVLDVNDRPDLIVGRYLDQVLHGPALALLVPVRNLVYL